MHLKVFFIISQKNHRILKHSADYIFWPFELSELIPDCSKYTNKNTKVCSIKSNEHIRKKVDGLYRWKIC